MKTRKILLSLLFTLIFILFGACGNLVQEQTQKNNAEIRQWYNEQTAVIPQLNEQWIKDEVSAEERAKRAYGIRHDARIKAREMMQNQEEVKLLRERDMQKYGNPDGPTFDYLVEKNRSKGLTGDDIYEAIIESSKRTNKKYNKKYGVEAKPDEE